MRSAGSALPAWTAKIFARAVAPSWKSASGSLGGDDGRTKASLMLTQIYEVSTPSEADAISGLGIDHVGVLAGNGAFPRDRLVRDTAGILAAIRASAKPVAV